MEQSDICLALDMTKIANGGISHATTEETQFLIKKPYTTVQEEKMSGIESHGHETTQGAIHRRQAMLRQHETNGCLS
jgi:hypothetical protein